MKITILAVLTLCFASVLYTGCLSSTGENPESALTGHWKMYRSSSGSTEEFGPYLIYVSQSGSNITVHLGYAPTASGCIDEQNIAFTGTSGSRDSSYDTETFTGIFDNEEMTGTHVLSPKEGGEDGDKEGTWSARRLDWADGTISLYIGYVSIYPPQRRYFYVYAFAERNASSVYAICDAAPGKHYLNYDPRYGQIGSYALWYTEIDLGDIPVFPLEFQVHVDKPPGEDVYSRTLSSGCFIGEVSR